MTTSAKRDREAPIPWKLTCSYQIGIASCILIGELIPNASLVGFCLIGDRLRKFCL